METLKTIFIIVASLGLLAWAWWLGQFPAALFRLVCGGIAVGVGSMLLNLFDRYAPPFVGDFATLVGIGALISLAIWVLQPIRWGIEDYFVERAACAALDQETEQNP